MQQLRLAKKAGMTGGKAKQQEGEGKQGRSPSTVLLEIPLLKAASCKAKSNKDDTGYTHAFMCSESLYIRNRDAWLQRRCLLDLVIQHTANPRSFLPSPDGCFPQVSLQLGFWNLLDLSRACLQGNCGDHVSRNCVLLSL